MRIGIFGGSFDPVHYGHLLLAEICRESANLDKVIFVPSATSPLKRHGPIASDDARVEMLRLALGAAETMEIDRLEIDRGGVSFTIDTVVHLQKQHPDAELHFMMGADIVGQLSEWKEPEKIFAIAHPLVLNRGGHVAPDLKELRNFIPEEECERQMLVNMPQLEISSSDIRKRIKENRSIRFQTPRAIEEFIRFNSIYA